MGRLSAGTQMLKQIEILNFEVYKFLTKYSNYSLKIGHFGALIFQELEFLTTNNWNLLLYDLKI